MIPYLSPSFLKSRNSSGGLTSTEIQALIDSNRNTDFVYARTPLYGISVVHDSSNSPVMISTGEVVIMKTPLIIDLVVDSTGEPVTSRC